MGQGSRAYRLESGAGLDPLLAGEISDCPSYDTWPGEMRLALAVVEDAITTVRMTAGVHTPRAHRLACEALAWLTSRDTSHPYAFENLCDHLGLNAAWLRRGLRRGGHDTTLHPRSAPRRRERGWYAVADA